MGGMGHDINCILLHLYFKKYSVIVLHVARTHVLNLMEVIDESSIPRGIT